MKQELSAFEIVVRALWTRLNLFLMITILLTTGVVVYAFMATQYYRSAMIFKVNSSDASSFGLGKIGMIGNLMSDMGDEVSLQILSSRALKTSIIRKFSLIKRWKLKNIETALKKFDKAFYVSVESTDGSIFMMEMEYPNPDTAKLIVDHAFQVFNEMHNNNRIQYATDQYQFYAGLVNQYYGDLYLLSDSVVLYMKDNNILEIDAQAQQVMTSIGQIDQEIISTSVELQSLYENFWNQGSAKHTALSKRLEILQQAKNSIMNGYDGSPKKRRTGPQLKKIPELTQRLKLYESKAILVLELLSYAIPKMEKHRVDMLDKTPHFQVIDPSYVAEYKVRPKRAIIMLVGGVLSIIMAFCIVISLYIFNKSTRPPVVQAFLESLKDAKESKDYVRS